MERTRARSLGCRWRNTLIAACAAGLLVPASASADALFYNWDMYVNSVNTYGGARTVTKYPQQYRWTDRPPTSSRISTNLCSNYNFYYYRDFGQITTYQAINVPGNNIGGVGWNNGTCIVYRGRSLGTIGFNDHDGSALY